MQEIASQLHAGSCADIPPEQKVTALKLRVKTYSRVTSALQSIKVEAYRDHFVRLPDSSTAARRAATGKRLTGRLTVPLWNPLHSAEADRRFRMDC